MKQDKLQPKTGKKAPRQRNFGDRERISRNYQIYVDQDKALRELAKETTNGNVQLAVRNVFDKEFGLPKEDKDEN